jgi:hypothetical protein
MPFLCLRRDGGKVELAIGAILGIVIASLCNIWYKIGRLEKPSDEEDVRKRIKQLEDQLRAIKEELARF